MKAMRRRLALPTPKAFASPALPATAGRQCEIPQGRLFLFCEVPRLPESAHASSRRFNTLSLTLYDYRCGVAGEIRMIKHDAIAIEAQPKNCRHLSGFFPPISSGMR